MKLQNAINCSAPGYISSSLLGLADTPDLNQCLPFIRKSWMWNVKIIYIICQKYHPQKFRSLNSSWEWNLFHSSRAGMWMGRMNPTSGLQIKSTLWLLSLYPWHHQHNCSGEGRTNKSTSRFSNHIKAREHLFDHPPPLRPRLDGPIMYNRPRNFKVSPNQLFWIPFVINFMAWHFAFSVKPWFLCF